MTEDAVIDFVPEIVKASEVVRKKLLRRLISADYLLIGIDEKDHPLNLCTMVNIF